MGKRVEARESADPKNKQAALPTGLAVSFHCLAAQASPQLESRRQDDARRLLRWLSQWIPAYARSVFATERTRWRKADWDELERDVIQHTLLACIHYGAERWARTTDDHALRWTRKVVKNFLISNGFRWRMRNQAPEIALLPVADAQESEIHVQRTFVKFVRLMRGEIQELVRPRDVAAALLLFDEFVSCVLVSGHGEADSALNTRASSRSRQRRRRGRLMAARAWQRLAVSLPGPSSDDELGAIAAVLGIDAVDVGDDRCHAETVPGAGISSRPQKNLSGGHERTGQ
jgi:hypothetical protein